VIGDDYELDDDMSRVDVDALVAFLTTCRRTGVAFGYLAGAYVDPEHRGRGLGLAVVRELVEGNGADGFR
jgi:ribosomal protein S18 acetylase RimI-like enzyme